MNSIQLIIDTSHERSFIAFGKEGKLLISDFFPQGLQGSKHLFSSIQKGLEQLDLQPEELQAIGVACGPGSFTGIRVGLSAAKGLVFSAQVPLIEFCSLTGFVSEGQFTSVIDARIGGYYCQRRQKRAQEIFDLEPVMLKPKIEVSGDLVGPHNSRPDAAFLVAHCHRKYLNNQISSAKNVNPLYIRSFSKGI